jgi:SAM-dependent methyltransferase
VSEPPHPRTRWSGLAAGRGDAATYQRRFDELAAAGRNVHGEADLVASLESPPARVLDAGCGTGRVAGELSRRGFQCTGVDADAGMISVARQRDPSTTYEVRDLAELALPGPAFDLVLLAGNVIPLLAPDTLDTVVARVAAHTRPGGRVVAGFGLDAAHLPGGCPVTPLAAYEEACRAAGLSAVDRFATWERDPWSREAGYVVALHILG